MIQTETERKFLVRNDDYKKEAVRSYRIRQGYIAQDCGNTVRVRIREAVEVPSGDSAAPAGAGEAFLTIKGPSADRISRTEWEMEIPVAEAESLLELCGGRVIDKIRHLVPETAGPHTFEVDEFLGLNAGLTVAEIEFPEGSHSTGSSSHGCRHAGETFHRPSWLGPEVTSDRRYTNAALSLHPFSTWEQD